MNKRKFEYPGGYLHYYDSTISPRSSAVILFLHGWGLASEVYMSSLKVLAQDYRVIAPDLPGFGYSCPVRKSYGYDDFANVIVAMVLSLGINQFHLIGHSMGGGIGINVASNHSSMVKSLILVDSSGIPLGSTWKLAVQRIIELSIQLSAPGDSSIKHKLFRVVLRNGIKHFRSMAFSWNMPITYDLESLMEKVYAPCSILWGEKDRLTPFSHGQRMEQMIAQSKLIIINDEYHEWCILHPERFVTILYEQFKRIDG